MRYIFHLSNWEESEGTFSEGVVLKERDKDGTHIIFSLISISVCIKICSQVKNQEKVFKYVISLLMFVSKVFRLLAQSVLSLHCKTLFSNFILLVASHY